MRRSRRLKPVFEKAKKQQPDLSVPPAARLFEDKREFEINQVLNNKPTKPKLKSKNYDEQLLELELAVKVRDRYIKTLYEHNADIEAKNKIYERFFMDMEVSYSLLKDYRAVQDLIDRACQWSSAHRNVHGELGPIDKAAALELATKRLNPQG